MITYSPSKQIASGASGAIAKVIQMMPNIKTLKVSGSIGFFFDAAHAAAGIPIQIYSIPPVSVSSMGVNLEAALESAGIAKYPDLSGGVQS